MSTRLFYPSTDRFFEQRFGNEAGFGILRCHCCQWTSVGADYDFAVVLTYFGCASHFLEQGEHSIDSFGPGPPFCFRQKIAGKAASEFAQAGAKRPRAETFACDAKKIRKQTTVGPGKDVFCALGQAIVYVRAAYAGSCSRPPNQAVSFKINQMGANGVVGNAKFVRQLIDCSVPGQEQGEKPAARAFEKALTPSGIFHDLVYFTSRNKSKQSLTIYVSANGFFAGFSEAEQPNEINYGKLNR